MESELALQSIPDDELLRRLGELVSHSRHVEAELVSHIGEVDKRRLYAREACPSMFAYCTERLHLSESEAYLRITVARAAREHPLLLTMLGDGRLHLSGIAKLVPLLTRENRDVLLERAAHLSRRRIVELVAELAPRPDVSSIMRKLPQRRPSQVSHSIEPPRPSLAWPAVELGPDRVDPSAPQTDGTTRDEIGEGSATQGARAARLKVAFDGPPLTRPMPSQPAVVEPLSPARYKIQFTASARLHDKLRAALRPDAV